MPPTAPSAPSAPVTPPPPKKKIVEKVRKGTLQPRILILVSIGCLRIAFLCIG